MFALAKTIVSNLLLMNTYLPFIYINDFIFIFSLLYFLSMVVHRINKHKSLLKWFYYFLIPNSTRDSTIKCVKRILQTGVPLPNSAVKEQNLWKERSKQPPTHTLPAYSCRNHTSQLSALTNQRGSKQILKWEYEITFRRRPCQACKYFYNRFSLWLAFYCVQIHKRKLSLVTC